MIDPWDLIHPPVKVEAEPDPQPVPLADYFDAERAPASRSQVRRMRVMAVDCCRFNAKGEHVFTGEHCVHYDSSDEEGPRVAEGWTCQ